MPRTKAKALWLLAGVMVLLGSVLYRPRSLSNGVPYPKDWRRWAVVSVSQRTDNGTMRVILGNPTAIAAVREKRTNPWPQGAILAKVVWRAKRHETWQAAVAPGEFVHMELMVKDSVKYRDTYGWGWARWVGLKQKPFNEGPQSCISCHQPVKNRDWVFTTPAIFP